MRCEGNVECMGEQRNAHKASVEKIREKSLVESSRHWQEKNAKIDLKEIGSECADCIICLRIGRTGRLLLAWQGTCMFHTM
jgi:hypothetical protein